MSGKSGDNTAEAAERKVGTPNGSSDQTLCRRFFPKHTSCFASLNHISRETPNIARLEAFYHDVLGFEKLDAPKFPFAVSWLSIPGGSLSLHLIESSESCTLAESGCRNAATGELVLNRPELKPVHIRRGHHLAFDTIDMDSMKAMLNEAGVKFAEASVPGTDIRQMFFFDPDGNGIECIHNPERLRTMGLLDK